MVDCIKCGHQLIIEEYEGDGSELDAHCPSCKTEFNIIIVEKEE